MSHIPVLLEESLALLDLHEGDIYLDATLGQSGHLNEVKKRGIVARGIDADPTTNPDAVLNFREIAKAPEVLGIKPTKILFDLGWNKSQFEGGAGVAGRGFSFQKDEPLNMTFGPSAKFTAEEIVNEWDQENLETILTAYGEEKFAKAISEEIVEARRERKIKTSFDLVSIIERAVPGWYKHKKIHFATKTFQALRIAVNDELEALKEGLAGAFEILPEGGKVAVISFHSLEDRIVKRTFKDLEEKGLGKILTKRPMVATRVEVKENPRSRSAKLRAIEKI